MKIKQNTKLSSVMLINSNREVEFMTKTAVEFKELLEMESVPQFIKNWEKLDFKLEEYYSEKINENLSELRCEYYSTEKGFTSLLTTIELIGNKNLADFEYMYLIKNSKNYYDPEHDESYHIVSNKIVATTIRGYLILEKILTKRFFNEHVTYDLSLSGTFKEKNSNQINTKTS